MRDQLLVSKTAVPEKQQRDESQTVRHSYRQVVELWCECGGLPQHEATVGVPIMPGAKYVELPEWGCRKFVTSLWE